MLGQAKEEALEGEAIVGPSGETVKPPSLGRLSFFQKLNCLFLLCHTVLFSL